VHAEPGQIAAIVSDAQAPGELRAQALLLMGEQPRTSAAFQQALNAALGNDAPPALHQAGLEQLLTNDAERLVREALATLNTRSLPEQQHAIRLLAKAAHPGADRILNERAEALFDGTGERGLMLDIVEALRVRSAF